MNAKVLLALGAGVIAGIGAAAWWLERPLTPGAAPPAEVPASAEAGRKVLYWYDPMVPDQKFDKPGKSPFMDMDLVPKYADEAAGGEGVSISARTVQNLGVRTAFAERGRLSRHVDTVGYVRADDHRVFVVQARTVGWIERLRVRAVNEAVKRGQVLAEVYSPDLFAVQEEYLLAHRRNDSAWAQAAQRKLSFLGMGDAQIRQLERTGSAQRRVAYHAPSDGVITELPVREGSSVSAGMPMMTVADLSRVWVTAEVVENQAREVRRGQPATVQIASLPGHDFSGQVEYVYPVVNVTTRTLQVRLVLENPELLLKPGMYAKVRIESGQQQEVVLVPSEAVITTGRRALVLIAGDGGFRPVPVRTGAESEGRTEILAGLSGGERIVTSSQFLIESEANLKGAIERLAPPEEPTFSGTARVVSVNADAGELEMAHDPLPALNWPAMTMPFEVKDRSVLKGLQAGQRVEFEVVREGNRFLIVAIRAEGAPTPPSLTGAPVFTGTARVVAVNADTGDLEMEHDPLPALNWPAMTMPFDVKDRNTLKGLKAGQQVEFDVVRDGESFSVVAIRPRAQKP